MKYSTISLIAKDFDDINKENVKLVTEIVNNQLDTDLILFPGWTLRNTSDLDKVLKKNKNNKTTFVLEVGGSLARAERGKGIKNIKSEGFYVIKGSKIVSKTPIRQVFSTSDEANKDKDNLLENYLNILQNERMFTVKRKKIRLIICGENNVLTNKQAQSNKVCLRWDDKKSKTQFQDIVDRTDVFLNPAHTPMGNLGKLKKRWAYLSKDSKICLFTTNECVTPNVKSNPKKHTANIDKKSLQYIFNDGKEQYCESMYNAKYKITTLDLN
jgi:hypothetical protein